MKKILIAMTMFLPMVASAETVEIDGISYNLINKAKTAEVTFNPKKYKGIVSIPETVSYNDVTYQVTCIGEYAFADCSSLTSINIPNSVTSIGYYAFQGCNSLTAVHISDLAAWCKINFGYISNPLSYAHHLYINGEEIDKDLVVPNSVTSIRDYVFEGLSGLTSINISNSVTSIGAGAFEGCSGLESLTIPNSVTTIGYYAFMDCSGLTSVNISNSVTSIGAGAFQGCSSLTSLTIPNSVTSISSYAFYECSGLMNISIPNTVTTIGFCAFSNCPELTDVYCYAETVPKTESDAFQDTFIEYATLHVPAVSIDAYRSAEPWKNFKNIVVDDPSGIQGITLDKGARSPVYDLKGRRLQEPAKGINIIGGKKVIVK
jgi:hypothetical protein